MSELASLQSAFASGLLGQDDAILGQIQPGRFAPDAVLQIYRNNVILGLTEVLASSYPAVAAMVGEAFFAAAARGFVLAEPLEEGSVMHYGEGFGDWLTRLPTTQALPWLGELARFEWLLERASLLAPEARRWPAERLAALAPSQWDRLVLHPACDLLLLESQHPVMALWQMALHGGETVSELDAPCWLALKKRPGHRVEPIPLDATPWRLLQGCQQGWSLASLLAQDPAMAEHLAPLITLDLLVDLELAP
ncbi:HvfC/BufC family peptide modification chaperone [Aeromonas rivipollensis]|uniref:HvfC/BufC family peptide modification chaperone n=1 Tax=Aeromonas rivipollensis TaxID=948519 RepID=UPI003D1B7065